MTILVGPNNSGKSLALREIAQWAVGGDAERNVIAELDVDWPDSLEALQLLGHFETVPNQGEIAPQADSILISPFTIDGAQNRMWVARQTLAQQLVDATSSSWLRQMLLGHFVVRLDGRTRFALMSPRGFQDLQLPPQHHLAALFRDDALRSRVRELVAEAFPDNYFVVDPTQMQQFRVQMSRRPPLDSAEERNWDDRAQQFHHAATPIEELSDGVVCFTGLVAAALSLPHRILLVDEPEAFLHPPLARLLGSDLAALTAERDASLVAATHSAEFLMGCIESGVDTTIVRLTYENEVAGARMLSPADLQALITDPLLRSTKALTGLFHRGVVVGESDHDRALYDEVNRRLVAAGRGAPDTFFTNAQNWQTIPRIIAPLRALGVPAAAIVDLDTVAGFKREWKKFYDACALDASAAAALEAKRAKVAADLKNLGKDGDGLLCKKVGIAGLGTTERASAQALCAELASYGIFVVAKGELESWLPHLGVSRGSKAAWIVGAFNALGSNPRSKKYVRAGTGDVWAFLDGVGRWIKNPGRQGLP